MPSEAIPADLSRRLALVNAENAARGALADNNLDQARLHRATMVEQGAVGEVLAEIDKVQGSRGAATGDGSSHR